MPEWLPLDQTMKLHLTPLFLRKQTASRKFRLFKKNVCKHPPNMSVEFKKDIDEKHLYTILSRRKGFSIKKRHYHGDVNIDHSDDSDVTRYTVSSRMCSRHHVFTLILLYPVTVEGALMAGTLREVDIRTNRIQLWSAHLHPRR